MYNKDELQPRNDKEIYCCNQQLAELIRKKYLIILADFLNILRGNTSFTDYFFYAPIII